jgi:hypothetical protein
MRSRVMGAMQRGLASRRHRGVLVLAVVIATSSVAFAHGDAWWIQQNPEYVDKFGYHCCSPNDCERIPESFVRQDGQDIYVLPTRQKFRKGERGTYRSRDSSWWWCKSRQLPAHIQPLAACIFFPFDDS